MTVKLFTYSAYQDCTKGFHLVTRKDVALAGGGFHRNKSSLRVEKVVLDETRVAALHLDKGAFVNFFQFGGISEKRGVQNIKLLKGSSEASSQVARKWIGGCRGVAGGQQTERRRALLLAGMGTVAPKVMPVGIGVNARVAASTQSDEQYQ